MAEAKGAKQIALSRALGAAFLNHQVEQLEKSVGGRGASSGNWRDKERERDKNSRNNNSYSPPKRDRGNQYNNRKRDAELPRGKDSSKDQGQSQRLSEEQPSEKDADIVVVDSSVLIHAINHLKRWCKNGREEVVIIPLEALNTLDLLKKGTNSLAQRARAASRILESQVGNNPRIRVQRDDAFVPWDDIEFDSDIRPESISSDTGVVGDRNKSPSPPPANGSPEWVRRTVCCARWELEHTAEETDASKLDQQNASVVLAVCTTAPSSSPSTATTKLPFGSDAETTNAVMPLPAVPLPAPSLHSHMHQSHTNKHEPRTMGSQVSLWARKAGIKVIDVKPAPPLPPHSTSSHNHKSKNGSGGGGGGLPRSSSEAEEDHRPKRILGKGGHSRRPPTAEKNNEYDKYEKRLNGGLVERSPAVLAMMEMVQRPDSKAVRVLARGEKLDPDT